MTSALSSSTNGADINARTRWWAGGFGILEHDLTLEEARPLMARGAKLTAWAATRAITQVLVDTGAELDVVDRDHNATPLQYLIGDEQIARLLIDSGASVDVFAAARLGDAQLANKCLRADSLAAEARIGRAPFCAPGMHIYGWTLGFDLTPADVARKFGHPEVAELLTAAWWYRPESVRLMLEVGFDPHVTGAHLSTPLDRASFHGYADIVKTLLELDPNPPLTQKSEFGAIPLRTCIYGSMNGWKTGFPQDHARTLTLLLEAGSPLDPTFLPTGNDELDGLMRDWLKNDRSGHGN